MATMEDFYTRPTANAGVKMPLITPTGERSEHWLQVLGVDSDAFREANAAAQRRAVDIAQISDDAERKAVLADEQRKLVAALVSGWSFDQPCTRDVVAELFRQAPQIQDAVDKIASQRAIFFAISSASSNATPSNNSGSTKSQKAQRRRSGRN